MSHFELVSISKTFSSRQGSNRVTVHFFPNITIDWIPQNLHRNGTMTTHTIQLLQSLSQSVDLKQIENMWAELNEVRKQAVRIWRHFHWFIHSSSGSALFWSWLWWTWSQSCQHWLQGNNTLMYSSRDIRNTLSLTPGTLRWPFHLEKCFVGLFVFYQHNQLHHCAIHW